MQTNLFRPIELDQPTNLELVGRLIHSLQTNLFSSGHAQTNQRMELVGQTNQFSELVGPRHMGCVIPVGQVAVPPLGYATSDQHSWH